MDVDFYVSMGLDAWHLEKSKMHVKKSSRRDRSATRFRGIEIDWTWSPDQRFLEVASVSMGLDAWHLEKVKMKIPKNSRRDRGRYTF